VFIDHILRLPEETEMGLVNDLKPIIQKEAVQMGLSMKDTFLAKYYMQEGKKEGMQEGIKKGIKEGRKEGIKEGKIKGKIEIALRLLEKGYSVEDAADITGLSIDEVIQMKDRK
jgi:predicted transposase/invertase (TIGR01784 family)